MSRGRSDNGDTTMRKNTTSALKGMGAVALALALTACGSGLSSPTTSSASSGSGSGSGSSGSTSTQVGTSLVELGNGVGATFANQALSIQVTNLAAGGTTGITATLVDANNGNALYTTQAVTVTFTSTCVAQGLAAFDTASVTSSTGQVSVNYNAQGCATTDTVKATVFIGSKTLIATGQITVAPATLGSLIFQGANPTIIGIAGMGGVTSSKVTFQLLDSNSHPVPDVTVSFSLDVATGGVTISPLSAITAADGTVSTFVQSGTAHITVHVSATATSNGITKTGGSSGLTISTGVPTERNFTLVLSSHNVEGNSVFLGSSISTVTVGLLDRYNNPVPDGTQVAFTANGGGIPGNCVTSGGTGTCQVTWTAQLPVPDPRLNSQFVLDHAHLLAYTTGEEHFLDGDHNGVFATTASISNADTFTPFAGNAAALDGFLGGEPPQDDVGDPYMDTNEDGSYELGEFFADATTGAARRAPDGLWHGEACGGIGSAAASVSALDENGAIKTVQCGTSVIMIGKEDCIVMTSSDLVELDPTVNNSSSLPLSSTGTPTPISVGSGTTTHTYYILDSNGDVPPKGATVNLTLNSVVGATITFTGGASSVTVPDIADACFVSKGSVPGSATTAPFKGYAVTVLVTPATGGTATVSGSFTISVKTPVSNVTDAGITVPVGP